MVGPRGTALKPLVWRFLLVVTFWLHSSSYWIPVVTSVLRSNSLREWSLQTVRDAQLTSETRSATSGTRALLTRPLLGTLRNRWGLTLPPQDASSWNFPLPVSGLELHGFLRLSAVGFLSYPLGNVHIPLKSQRPHSEVRGQQD